MSRAKEKIDLVDDGKIIIENEDLKHLSRDELKEIIQFLDEDDDAINYKKVKQAIVKKKVDPIEKAKLGHRVWSYFYDKYIIRIILVFWVGISLSVIAKSVPQKIMMEHGKEIEVSKIIMAAGIALIIIAWHLILAFFESTLNKKNPGSSYRRAKIGLRIVTQDGSAPGYIRSLLRGIFKGMPLAIFVLMFMETEKNERGIHDKIFATYVVHINDSDVSQSDIARFIAENY